MSHLHLIGAGGIGVSAIGRYYKSLGWSVSGSDGASSDVTRDLEREGITIAIGHKAENLPAHTDLVVYSEAIITKPDLSKEEQLLANPELRSAKEKGIKHRSYPESLGDIANPKYEIAVTGSHGKSTTTGFISVMLANSSKGGSTIVGTKLSNFGGTNLRSDPASPYFAIEACEYRRSFLHYTPEIAVITNIDLDHLDYYKDVEDYISAFVSFVENTKTAVILPANDANCKKLYERVSEAKRTALKWYFVEQDSYTVDRKKYPIPKLTLKVPGDHLAFDANLAYVAGQIIEMKQDEITSGLEAYSGAWRRSELVGETENGNLVYSDYGHHPNEIAPTLKAIKEANPDRFFVVIFQPHQYSRTRELLDEFATCFGDADELIVPNIYFSRDKKEDVEWMTVDRLLDAIEPHNPNLTDGEGLENTEGIILQLDEENPGRLLFLLLGAGNVDELRYNIL